MTRGSRTENQKARQRLRVTIDAIKRHRKRFKTWAKWAGKKLAAVGRLPYTDFDRAIRLTAELKDRAARYKSEVIELAREFHAAEDRLASISKRFKPKRTIRG